MAGTISDYPRQEIWFTSDLCMFNYDCIGERFHNVCGGELQQIALEEAIGLTEKTMEELGQLC